ncbi:hypothetical protein [Paraglaciecola sp.]|uniref:hypothetical protein n=1 Tax=Paraglaciecola sp. TaxID=1920173 RepID=UPI0030F3BD3D
MNAIIQLIMIMAVLGVVIGGVIVAMYLPIFEMGNVIWQRAAASVELRAKNTRHRRIL